MKHQTDNTIICQSENNIVRQYIEDYTLVLLEKSGEHQVLPKSAFFTKGYDIRIRNFALQPVVPLKDLLTKQYIYIKDYTNGEKEAARTVMLTLDNWEELYSKMHFEDLDRHKNYDMHVCELDIIQPSFPKLVSVIEVEYGVIKTTEYNHLFSLEPSTSPFRNNRWYYSPVFGSLIHTNNIHDLSIITIEDGNGSYFLSCPYFSYQPNTGEMDKPCYYVVIEEKDGVTKRLKGYIDTYMYNAAETRSGENIQILPIPLVRGYENIVFNNKTYQPLPKLTRAQVDDIDRII